MFTAKYQIDSVSALEIPSHKAEDFELKEGVVEDIMYMWNAAIKKENPEKELSQIQVGKYLVEHNVHKMSLKISNSLQEFVV